MENDNCGNRLNSFHMVFTLSLGFLNNDCHHAQTKALSINFPLKSCTAYDNNIWKEFSRGQLARQAKILTMCMPLTLQFYFSEFILMKLPEVHPSNKVCWSYYSLHKSQKKINVQQTDITSHRNPKKILRNLENYVLSHKTLLTADRRITFVIIFKC